jgi:hypothetical protein
MALALELDCNSLARIGTSGRRVGSSNVTAGRCVKVNNRNCRARADYQSVPFPLQRHSLVGGLSTTQRWGRFLFGGSD